MDGDIFIAFEPVMIERLSSLFLSEKEYRNSMIEEDAAYSIIA